MADDSHKNEIFTIDLQHNKVLVDTREVGIQARPVKANCCHSSRFVVLAISACLLALITSNTAVWNTAIIAIVDVESSPKYNSSVVSPTPEYYNDFELELADRRILYTPMEKSLLFAAVFIGAIFGIVPVELLIRYLGGYRSTILLGLVSVVCSALVPVAASCSFVILLILRLLLGATLPLAFPLISTVISSWSSVSESGIFVGILTGYLQLCAVFTMPVTGFFSAHVSWCSVFYVHSAAMAALVAIWIYNYRDDPFRHRFVSENEYRKISVGKEIGKTSTKIATPYKQICTSIPVLVVWIAAAGNYLAGQFVLTFWPAYLVKALGYSLEEAGYIAVIPVVLQFLAKFLSGTISDKCTCLPKLHTIRLLNSVAFFGSAAMFAIAGLVQSAENRLLSMSLVMCAIILLGFNAGGFPKSAILISRQHSRFVMSAVQVVLCVSMCGGSFMVPNLAPNSTAEEFSLVFYIYATGLCLTNLVFVCFSSVEPQPFTKTS